MLMIMQVMSGPLSLDTKRCYESPLMLMLSAYVKSQCDRSVKNQALRMLTVHDEIFKQAKKQP